MDAERRDQLEQQHQYGEWRGRSALGPGVFVQGFAFAGRELPSWQLQRAERKPGPPPRTTALWRRPSGVGSLNEEDDAGVAEVLLRVDVYECGTVDAAHDYVIELLGDFQATEIRRRAQSPVGDVAFGTPLVLLFARANVVVLVRNAGRRVVEVVSAARELDAHLMSLLTRGQTLP